VIFKAMKAWDEAFKQIWVMYVVLTILSPTTSSVELPAFFLCDMYVFSFLLVNFMFLVGNFNVSRGQLLCFYVGSLCVFFVVAAHVLCVRGNYGI
jgi:hypothetical protein